MIYTEFLTFAVTSLALQLGCSCWMSRQSSTWVEGILVVGSRSSKVTNGYMPLRS